MGVVNGPSPSQIISKNRATRQYKNGGERKMLFSSPVILMKAGGAKDKNWIQKAVNPKHKGFCTPMSKATCTPRRKALARTFKKMAKNR
jgi:hypothetical protein